MVVTSSTEGKEKRKKKGDAKGKQGEGDGGYRSVGMVHLWGTLEKQSFVLFMRWG